MAVKFAWLRTIGKKFIALKENLELRAEEREAKRFSSMDSNPFLIQNRNKRFSTYRSELVHGIMLKPLDKFLDKESCQTMGRSFMKYEMNKYFTFKVQCIEDINKET